METFYGFADIGWPIELLGNIAIVAETNQYRLYLLIPSNWSRRPHVFICFVEHLAKAATIIQLRTRSSIMRLLLLAGLLGYLRLSMCQSYCGWAVYNNYLNYYPECCNYNNGFYPQCHYICSLKAANIPILEDLTKNTDLLIEVRCCRTGQIQYCGRGTSCLSVCQQGL